MNNFLFQHYGRISSSQMKYDSINIEKIWELKLKITSGHYKNNNNKKQKINNNMHNKIVCLSILQLIVVTVMHIKHVATQ